VVANKASSKTKKWLVLEKALDRNKYGDNVNSLVFESFPSLP